MPAPEESEFEPKPAERDQETARPMLSFEEYLSSEKWRPRTGGAQTWYSV
jgi:hypothetical protein